MRNKKSNLSNITIDKETSPSNPVTKKQSKSPKVCLKLQPKPYFPLTSLLSKSPDSYSKAKNPKFLLLKKQNQSSINKIQQACSLEEFDIIEKTYLGLYYESQSILRDDPLVIIHKALCKRTNKQVAVKSCKKQDFSIYSTLKKESQTLSRLDHKNIVKYIENFETEDSFHIVIEFIQGPTLFQFLKNQPFTRLGKNEVKNIFYQVIEGVEYLHKLGVAHGDLKLDNVLVCEQGVKIVDFGFSCSFDEVRTVFCGTGNYLSPEITLFQSYLPGPADVWALGVMLYTLSTGTFPFKAGHTQDLYKKIQKCSLNLPDYLSNSQKNIITKMLKPDPKSRPTLKKLKKNQFFSKQIN